MEQGTLKIKESRKIILKVGKFESSPPKEFDFSALAVGTYECMVERLAGVPTRIVVNGNDIPKNDALLQRKQEAQERKAQEEALEKQRQQEERKKPVVSKGGWKDSFDITETRLPKYLHNKGINTIDNFSLKYHRAARCIPFKGEDKFYFFKNDERHNKKTNETTGHKFLIQHNEYGNLNFQNLVQRQKRNVETIFNENQRKTIDFSPDWRFVVGLGGGSVYKTSITLHHIYGIPYIPASSIKGVVRSWIISECFGTEEDSEAKAFNQSQLLCDIFGCPDKISFEKNDKKESLKTFYGKDKKHDFDEKQGDAIFFDAFPTSAPPLEADVMNVHYKDWYKSTDYSPPTDTQATNPIMFLTVGNDVSFQTHFATPENKQLKLWAGDFEKLIKDTDLTGDSTLLDFIHTWLKKALSEHGIGAKTAIGYGYFQ